MAYSETEKYQLECEKLQQEIKALRRPISMQPGTWFTLITLVISIAVNLSQCSSSQRDKQLADISLQSTLLDIKANKVLKDSLDKQAAVTEQKIAEAEGLFQDLQSRIKDAQDKLRVIASGATSATPDAEAAIKSLNQSLTNISVASKSAALDLRNLNMPVSTSASKDFQQAAVYEKEGFAALTAMNFSVAAAAFSAAENAANGYHNAYELARLLRSEQAVSDDPEARKEVVRLILDKYSAYAPPEVVQSLKEQAGR